MRMRQMLSVLADTIVGERVYWMRVGNDKVSIFTCLSEYTHKAQKEVVSRNLAAKAEKLAIAKATKAGFKPVTTGVIMGGNGNGEVVATGIADLPWSPEIEHRLDEVGILQIK